MIGVYDYENRNGYLIDMNDFEGLSIVTLRTKNPKNNQKRNIRQEKDYVFFK